MILIVYTFDVISPDKSEDRPITSSGNAEVTMLRRSIRSLRTYWQDAFKKGECKIEVYTNTPRPLAKLLLDGVVSGDVKLKSLKRAQKKALASDVGDHSATSDQQKFASHAAGHARIWLLPYLLRNNNASNTLKGILYLDNDTVLKFNSAKQMLATLKQTDKCWAYERETGTCRDVMGPAFADFDKGWKYAMERYSPAQQNPPSAGLFCHVRNNGIMYLPHTPRGLYVADSIADVYSALPSNSQQRYLHDMVALSIVWELEPSQCTTLLPPHRGAQRAVNTGIVHYWANKTKPELQGRMVHRILLWRVEEDLALIHSCSDSVTHGKELRAHVLKCAEEDMNDLEQRAATCGLFHSDDSPDHLSKRSALRGMHRVKHPSVNPPSRRLAYARQRAKANLRDMIGEDQRR